MRERSAIERWDFGELGNRLAIAAKKNQLRGIADCESRWGVFGIIWDTQKRRQAACAPKLQRGGLREVPTMGAQWRRRDASGTGAGGYCRAGRASQAAGVAVVAPVASKWMMPG